MSNYDHIQSIIDAYKAGIAEKNKGGTIIYCNPFDEETQHDLHNAYHLGIYEQGTEKIKLHPMSEEPVIFADKHRSDSNVYIVSSGLYRAYGLNEKEEGAQQYMYIGDRVSWATIFAISSLACGWVYERELIQLIKDNTAS